MRNPFRHRENAPVALITITVMLGMIMAIIDTTIINVALNNIAGNLGASVDEVSWVATGYILANVCVLPLNGWLTATFGRRKFYAASLAIFTVSSFLCGTATNVTLLVIYRIIQGIGGIGANAVQGAVHAGAANVIAVDPVAFKREKALELGATHVAASVDEAWNIVSEITRGQLAEAAIITTGVAEGSMLQPALQLVGKKGRVVVTALGHAAEETASLSLLELTLYEKQVRGALFGSSNGQHDVPRLLEMYNLGQLKLDELITRKYRLEELNDAYRDLMDGKNIRGVLIHEE